MDDDDLRRHLTAPSELTGTDVEQALLHTRATGEARIRRRRFTVRVALPLATAAATAAVVIFATVHPGGPSRPKHPTASPTPSTTPTGAWFRHVVGVSSAASGSIDLAGVWIVRLTTPDDGSFDVRPADRFGAGTLHYDGSQGGWVVSVLHHFCGKTTGVYRVSFSGPSLIFNVVHDACEPRRDVMDNLVLAPLTNPDQIGG